MSSSICIYLYSKFSNGCNAFNQILNKSDNEILDIISLQRVCIDNEKVRKTIINSKKIQVNCVPCIVHISDDGQINNYEGEKCFAFFTNIVQNYTQKISEQMELQEQQEHEELEFQENKRKVQQNRKIKKKKKTVLSKQSKTNISDLDSENEQDNNGVELLELGDIDDIDDNVDMSTGELGEKLTEMNNGNRDLEDEQMITTNKSMKMKDVQREQQENSVQTSIQKSNGGGNIMAAAMQMQKQREAIKTQN